MKQVRIGFNTHYAAPNTFCVVSTEHGHVDIYLPPQPVQGDRVAVKHSVQSFMLTVNGNGKLIDGVSVISSQTARDYWLLEFDGTEWMVT